MLPERPLFLFRLLEQLLFGKFVSQSASPTTLTSRRGFNYILGARMGHFNAVAQHQLDSIVKASSWS
jgi:hypothetical protein